MPRITRSVISRRCWPGLVRCVTSPGCTAGPKATVIWCGRSSLAPTGWTLPVREVRLAAGAGYVYAICGTMRTMPGLSKSPAAERIGFDENGVMVGLS